MVNPVIQNIKFREFLFQQKTLIYKIAACAAILTVIGIIIVEFHFIDYKPESWLSYVNLVIYFNTIVITLIILLALRFSKSAFQDEKNSNRLLYRLNIIYSTLFTNSSNLEHFHATPALKHLDHSKLDVCVHKLKLFTKHFRAFFFTLLLLYFGMALVELFTSFFNLPIPDFINSGIDIMLFTLNNISACYIFRCFVELYLPSKKHPEKLRFHLNSFSLSIALSLTVIYSATLIYGDKNMYCSGEIVILETKEKVAEKFVDLNKQVKYHEENKEIVKGNSQFSLTSSNINDTLSKDTSLFNSVTRQIFNSDTLHCATEMVNEETKIPNQIIKAYYWKTRNDTIPLQNSLKLAFNQIPRMKDSIITIPSYLKVYKDVNSKTLIKFVNFKIADTSMQSFNAETLYIYRKPLSEKTETVFTGYKTEFNLGELKDGDLINYPEPLILYRKKRQGILSGMFDTISGLFNALALALLIGRLDSKLISLRNYIIAILFLYAAIQPLYPFLENNGVASIEIQSLILFVAFALKLLLFFIVFYVINTGRLLTYFYCFGELDKRADSVFANQFEFVIQLDDHHNKYSFVVNSNGQRIFKSDKLYQSLDIAMKSIKELQELIKSSPTKLKLFKGFDKNWLELNDDPNNIGIYSKDFEYNKIEEFRDEVLDNLPYCKVRILV